MLVQVWTPKRALEIEALLLRILDKVQGVERSLGCSYDKYEDFKIWFEMGKDIGREGDRFHMKYDPKEQVLSVWPGAWWALPVRGCPETVKAAIEKLFPQARYRTEKSHDGSFDFAHYWEGIDESMLQEAVM